MTGLETEQKSNENNNNDYGTSDKNGQPGIAKTSRIVVSFHTRGIRDVRPDVPVKIRIEIDCFDWVHFRIGS